MDRDEIQDRWQHCEPIEGIAFFPNDRAVVLDRPQAESAATVLALHAVEPEPEYEVQLVAHDKSLVVKQSKLASAVPHDIAECVAWIQKWYASQCDGDWEHENGLVIETLENPGWFVKIALEGTELETAEFLTIDRTKPERSWLFCKVVEKRWEGAGGPHVLGEILATFVRWARDRD